jgi:tRNA threonylcarbamoyladenosine dehydratase
MTNQNDWLTRTKLLLGNEKLQKLRNAHVLVAGLGGVGGYAAEALCRAGIGELTLADHDIVQNSNRNRQIIAMNNTIGKMKAEVTKERLLAINPDLQCHLHTAFLKDASIETLLTHPFDYVVDAIDTLAPKVFLIYHTTNRNIPIVTTMGAGAKTNPEMIRIADISETFQCPHAHMLRKKLHKLGIRSGIRAVFSPEPADTNSILLTEGESNKKTIVGTISYMPAIFGLMAASVVIRELTRIV